MPSRALAHKLRICLLLCSLMAGVYMLGFRGLMQSGDTLRAFDAVTSHARYGDWLMDESAFYGLPLRIREQDKLRLSPYDVDEKLQIQLAAPLLHLAQSLPRLGNIHAVWLFNVIVTSLLVGLIYLLTRALDYADSVALLVAISAGLATNLWAYSQAFFREPLTALFLAAAFLSLQVGFKRDLRLRALSWLGAALALALAAQVKYSAALALPALLCFALPESDNQPAWLRKASGILAALLMVGLALPMLIDPLPALLLDWLASRGLDGSYISDALRAYLLSPGASVWGTSPVALIAAAGCILLARRGQMRLVLTICTLLACYTLGHALLTGRHWFGGLSFPPRFLTPLLPVLMLAAAPIAKRMIQQRSRPLACLWMALLLYGAWIQFCAVSLSWSHYGDALPTESLGLSEWLPAMLEPRYFRWIVMPSHWSDLGWEFLWARAGLPFWAISFGAYSLALGYCLWRVSRDARSRWRHAALPLAFLCLPLTLLNLAAAYDKDPTSRSQSAALHEALEVVTAQSHADDLLLLSSQDYVEFVMNHLDSAQPRPIVLERPRAQAASDRQPARVVSSNPDDWFDVMSVRTILHLTRRHERIWLLAETSPWMTWSFRPMERFLALHYYPLREVALEHSDPTVRLLEYSTRSAAPSPYLPVSGDVATNLRYGEHIRLTHVSLPNGAIYRAGEAIEASLNWQTDAPLEHSYTVALFAVDAGGQVIAQGQDTAPQAGFAPTSGWMPKQPVWDHRALRLPDDAPPGDMALWLALYRYDTELGDIRRLPVTAGDSVHRDEIGVLPLRLILE